MHRLNHTLLVVAILGRIALATEPEIAFEADVRPIFKAHCFQCHGEAGETEGGLDLRLRRWIVAGGESGPAVVPKSPAASLLLKRIRSGDMPPGDDKQLSAKDVRTIEYWIQSGAQTARDEPESIGDEPIFTNEERNYWAFQPVVRPDIPDIATRDHVQSPIDTFVLERMRLSGHQPVFALAASRERLARRASFDLAGLPPTPASVAQFSADTAPDAVARYVDRLLASPNYGERWARHWLDVAGYADSEGYTDEDRERRHAYRYRDYVIRAFNDNRPFNQFIQEQLAGDELVSPPYANLAPEAIEQLTATGFLRMAPDGTASGGIDQSVARNQVIADTLQIVGTSLLGLTVHCAQCHDHRYDPIAQTDYYRLRAVFEPAFNWKQWRTPAARQISLYTEIDREQAKQIEAEAAAIDAERKQKIDEYLKITLDEELLLVSDSVREPLRSAFTTAAAKRTDEQKALLKEYPSVEKITSGSLYLYDRKRAERAGKIDAERERRLQMSLLAANAGGLQNITAETLASVDPNAAAELNRYQSVADQLRNRRVEVDLKTYADRAADVRSRKPEEHFLRALTEPAAPIPATFVFHRGDHEQPRAAVAPGDLSVLAETQPIPINDPHRPTTGRRLALARDLTNGRHPLVSRVFVNRLWLHHFGRGIVPTPGDFGRLGDRPTHPQLLDWLAAELVRNDWDVKRLHRHVMTSAVYCQDSQATTMDDPDNRWYSRYPVRRLEAEIIRDATLAVCDQLNNQLYGKPVPVMEDGVGQIVIGRENLDGERKPTEALSMAGGEFRRSVYVQIRRSRMLSMFDTFDAASLSPNCECRNSSTVTPQSLLMMNSDFAIGHADTFASRLIRDAGNDLHKQLTLAWRLAYSAVPRDGDIASALEFVTAQRTLVLQHTAQKNDGDIERAALAVFCQALLSSNRFLYID